MIKLNRADKVVAHQKKHKRRLFLGDSEEKIKKTARRRFQCELLLWATPRVRSTCLNANMKVFKLYENVGQQHAKCVPKTECNNNNTSPNNGGAMKRGTTIDDDDDTIIVGETNKLLDKHRHRYSIENFLTASVPSAVVAAAESVRSGLLSVSAHQQQYPTLDILTPCLKDVLLAAQLFGGKVG